MVIVFVAVLVLISLGILFFRFSFLQISSVDVSGIPPELSSIVALTAQDELKGTYLKIIPRSNIFLYPRDNIKQALTEKFKNIESILISRKGLSTISISLTERTKAALVCEGFHEDDSEDTSNCFFADEHGYIFAKASTTPSTDFIRYYIVTDKGDGIIGTSFIDSAHFKEIGDFVAGSLKAGIVPLGVLVSDNSQYEMYVKNAESEITVYFDTRTPLSNTLSNFVAFWNTTFNSTDKKATTTPKVDYINLRYGNTIFYSAQ